MSALDSLKTALRSARAIPVGIAVLALALLSVGLAMKPSSKTVSRLQHDFDEGLNLVPADCAAVYLPKAFKIDAALCVLLVGGWFIGRKALAAKDETAVQSVFGGQHRVVWVIVMATIITSALFNAKRLSMSLWNDEVLTMRNVVVGKVKRDKNDKLRLMPAPWVDTFYNYWQPNNHVLYSLTSRLSHAAWPFKPGPKEPYFSEAGLRFPAFIAGFAAMVALATLALRFGLHWEAAIAVVLLGLHPWFVRYGSEARGYAFFLLLVPVLILCIMKAVQSGAWRWWLVVGFVQFLLLYTNPLSIHVILPGVASTMLLVWLRWKGGRDRVTLLARMTTGSVLGAMFTVPLMLPLLPQLKVFMQRDMAGWEFNVSWLQDAALEMFTGVAWGKLDPMNPHTRPWGQVAVEHPLLVGVMILLLSVFFVAGIIALWRHSSEMRCLLPVLLLPAVELTVANAVFGKVLYTWYVIIGLPGLMLTLASGVMLMAKTLLPQKMSLLTRGLLAGVTACVLFGWATHYQRKLLRTVAIDPRHEAAALCNSTSNPKDPDIENVVIGGIGPAVYLDLAYNPGGVPVKSIEEIRALADVATKAKKPFFLCCGRADLAKERFPKEFEFVETSGLFEPVARVYGVDEQRTTMVYRYREPAK